MRITKNKSFLMAFFVATILAGCGGGDSPVPTPASLINPPTAVDTTEVEQALSPAALTVQLSPGGLVSATSPITLGIADGALVADLSQYSVYVNGALVDGAALAVSAGALQISAPLISGINNVQVYAPDVTGNPIEASLKFGAGSSVVSGRVVSKDGSPVVGAEVVASLGDDPGITARATTDAKGVYTLNNFPQRTVLVAVVGPSGIPGASSGIGGSPFPDTVLVEFGVPVSVANNDFSLGQVGWTNVNGASVSLIEHTEDVGPKPATTPNLVSFINNWLPLSTAHAQAVPKKDLKVTTSGQGPRTVTYTFDPPADTSSVKLRYRFQTTEFPRYYNTAYNDSFEVKLRSADGRNTSIAGTMNGLSSSSFDATGSTAWKELSLDLPASAQPGKPMQVDITVANVGDGKVDSSIIVDVVSTSKVTVQSATLFDIDNTALQFLSAAPHAFFGGDVRLNGIFTLKGPAESAVTSAQLQVFQGGVLKATGSLAPGLESKVYKSFGTKGVITVSDKALAFILPSSQVKSINTSVNGVLSLKLVVKTDKGEIASKDVGTVALLDIWAGTNRYEARNESEGGDGWVQPSARDVFSKISATYGDFSNMNGGHMDPHKSHQRGIDVDGKVDGYSARNADTAGKIIALLNTPGVQLNVKVAYVTYSPKAGDAFFDAIKAVKLTDGRNASSVIKPMAGHTTHFHFHVE